MVKNPKGKAQGDSSRTRNTVLVVVAVAALAIAGVLIARRALHEERTVPEFMQVTCKTCDTQYEVPYEVFREARDDGREIVADCPQCGSAQPCYTGNNPDRLPGQIPAFSFPDGD
jgi:hypothetical protein